MDEENEWEWKWKDEEKKAAQKLIVVEESK